MRIVFMGTPDFAVASLDAIHHSKHQVAAVVTIPDKPAGRGQLVHESPVKRYALTNSIPVLQPEKLKDEHFINQLTHINADAFVVVAFRMLPEVVWAMPPKGTINVHGSLLPQYRGAAPINRAVMNGDKQTGVTTFLIEKEIDTGRILFFDTAEILATSTAGQIHDILMAKGAALLLKTLNALEENTAIPIHQADIVADTTALKAAPKIFKDTCRILWTQPAEHIYNHIRGLSPYPTAWSVLRNSEGATVSVKIFFADFEIHHHSSAPGTIVTDKKSVLKIACADGWLLIRTLQAEGKKMMPIDEFLRGFHSPETYSAI